MNINLEAESELERARRRACRWSDTDPVDYGSVFCEVPLAQEPGFDWAEAVIGVVSLLILIVAVGMWLA